MSAAWQAGIDDPARARVVTEETFRFLGMPELWVVVLVLLPGVLLFAWWAYAGLRRLEPRPRALLVGLRGLAVIALLLAIFQPAFETKRYTTVQTQVHVLVDDSASMQRKDTYPDPDQRTALRGVTGLTELGGLTRSALVRQVLERPGGLLEELDRNHDLRLFRFSRRPLPIRDLSELSAKGPRTHIGDALDLHRSLAGSINLDALILVSDGRNNGGVSPVEVAARYADADTPIYTIGVGDPNPPHNVWIVGPPGPQEALRKEEVAFDTTVAAEGLEGRVVRVTLHASRNGGAYVPLSTQTATLGGDGKPVRVRLYHAFEEAGDYALRFEVSSFPEETSLDDNRDTRFLRVNDEKIRVLYLEDLPRWEYRYVKNGLLRVDPSIEVQCYLFDASRTFRQESSEGLPALDHLPRGDELRKYHVILIGDVPPERLGETEEAVNRWLEELVEFVEFGGGVGFLYGERAMPESYRGTPLEDLLPVVLEDRLELHHIAPDRTSSFVPQLDNPQRPHDIVLLKRDPDANELLWKRELEPLVVYYPVQQAKAGAEVLLRHPTDRNRYGNRPLVAVSEYPRGRTFFIATDETWRWRKPHGELYQDLFWRNVVRYLAGGRLRRRSDRIDLRVDKVLVETGEQVRVRLEVLDDELEPSRASEYPIFLKAAEGEPVRRTLPGVPGEAGSYERSFTMNEAGAMSFLVFANDNPADRVLARQDVLVRIPDREMRNSSQDREMLEAIARASKGGRYVFLANAEDLLEDFRSRKPYQHEVDRSIRPIWDTMWTLLVVVILLSIEWIVRKRVRLV